MARWVEPVTLTGTRVRMEPLDLSKHWEGLKAIGLEPSLWLYTLTVVKNEDDLKRYLDTAATELAEGRSLPFVTIDAASGRVVGCTRFSAIDERNRRVEIGWTWVGLEFQHSHVNTEAKYLMLRHAFEQLECVRVEFKANARNVKSRRAMERIGAQFEGTLRKHAMRDGGEWRDTVYYSILDRDWPAVKTRLEEMMQHKPVE